MGELFIKIKILDRTYSLVIDPKDERVLRNAGKLIEEKIYAKKEKLGVHDKQDLLAMIAFDYAVENLRLSEEKVEAILTLQDLDKEILDHLS
jgi:cell division protein ZapA